MCCVRRPGPEPPVGPRPPPLSRHHVDAASLAAHGGEAHRAPRAGGAQGVLCKRTHLYVLAHPHAVLSWLSFTVTLSALAAGLLNFGDKVGRVSAALFSFVGTFANARWPLTHSRRDHALRARHLPLACERDPQPR